MVKGIRCLDGTPIAGLHKASRKKVLCICDSCGKESKIMFCHLNYSRQRRGEAKDFCSSCSRKNPYPQEPQSSIGVPEPSSKRQDVKLRGRGYVRVRDESDTYIDQHRLVASQVLGREIDSSEHVHHIDGDKLNNTPDNLFVCSGGVHEKLHKQLGALALELVKQGLIWFDRSSCRYELSSDLRLASMPLSLGFDDVLIKQLPNICFSRSEADTSSEVIRGVTLKVPLIASNMSTVTNADFCILLGRLGGMGVLHRAAPEDWLVREVKKMASNIEWVPVSIGVGSSQFELCRKLVKAGANVVFIDIAHGYSESVISLGKKIKREFPTVKIVLGNTTNPDMVPEVFTFADALKVGIGTGLACTTKNTAGCHEKQFSAVHKFRQLSRTFKLPIISDGGIREPSHFTKAIAAGASAAMAGSIFARCPESSAEIIDGKKLYAGMASEYVQKQWRGGLKPGTCAEGKVVMLEVGRPASELLTAYEGALRSGITYVGAKDVKGLQDNAQFIRVEGGYL